MLKTEHLPECWAKDPSDPPAWCICDELRACEERVLDAAARSPHRYRRTEGEAMTEHLPIQRWTKVFTRYPASEVLPNENGEYVTYDDHLAALRACERQMLEEHRHRCSGCDWCYR